MAADPRDLLRKYMDYVHTYEGTTFVLGELDDWARDAGITEEEWAELRAVGRQVEARWRPATTPDRPKED